MYHTVLQLDAHLWVRGYDLTIMLPVQCGDFVHQCGSAMKGQAVTFKDHLAL